MRRMCYVCGARPARRLGSKIGYRNVTASDSFFCSRRCAADYGLLMAETSAEDQLYWCRTHGWHGSAWEGECPECPPTQEPAQ